MSRLENWSFCVDNSNPFLAPELRKSYVYGEIYEDDKGRFKDGSNIRTSTIVDFDINNMIIKTRNSTYKLDKISDSFDLYMKQNSYQLEDYKVKVVE